MALVQGKGVSVADMRFIMDPFFTTKRDSGGTGLGLSISQKIIFNLNGELRFESEPSKGTVVSISLPAQ